jgi:glycine hydroxymethyltransferase
MVPFDDKSPFVTSGIRIGAAAITTRGLKEDDMSTIVDFIDRVLLNPEDESELNAVAKEVHALMDQRPLFVGYTD